jgi:hypothetical protein
MIINVTDCAHEVGFFELVTVVIVAAVTACAELDVTANNAKTDRAAMKRFGVSWLMLFSISRRYPNKRHPGLLRGRQAATRPLHRRAA